MKRETILSLLLLLALVANAAAKREFRGAWIQCVNGQFQGLSTEKMQQTLSYQLDELSKDGVNAIIFQVRPECDALYQSSLEPWSRFLTGTQGKAPSPYWDPLQWMITECHRRGMELHAWINPYRAKTKTTTQLSTSHIAVQHPELCFDYDGLKLLNPGIPQCRDYICRVVADIVSRYDIDGLHIDDYFYPYPAAGVAIPDDAQFRQYNNGFADQGDWRRQNVNLFIQQLGKTVHNLKPWVKFGVSPFGIYRNNTIDKNGSNTRGLQNYDDLYADVLLWVNNGWIDYCVPQIYWQIGHKTADYQTLINWWNRNASNRPLYIGEDVERTAKYSDVNYPSINQMPAKFALRENMENVQGAVLWYAKAVVDDIGNYGTALRQNYWRYPALPPEMPFLTKRTPKKVKSLKTITVDGKKVLCWSAPKGDGWETKAAKYVVYRFRKGERSNLSDPSKIVSITSQPFYEITNNSSRVHYYYMVTALNRIGNESKAKKKSVK